VNTGPDDGWPVIKLLGTITDEDHRPLNEIEVTP
jgi:hypothetical protein